jgi:hypothetical protein
LYFTSKVTSRAGKGREIDDFTAFSQFFQGILWACEQPVSRFFTKMTPPRSHPNLLRKNALLKKQRIAPLSQLTLSKNSFFRGKIVPFASKQDAQNGSQPFCEVLPILTWGAGPPLTKLDLPQKISTSP